MFATIDRLLRGDFHDNAGTQSGRVSKLLTVLLISGAVYGACMGLYVVLRAGRPQAFQLPSSVVKVPLLLLLTQFVTIPSLYVFATLSGARLSFRRLFELMAGAMAMTAAVLASLGPITVFFTLSTDSHEFMVVLNVFFFVIGGLIGVGALNRSIGTLLEDSASSEAVPEVTAASRIAQDRLEEGKENAVESKDEKAGATESGDEKVDDEAVVLPSMDRAWRPRQEAPRSVLRTWLVMYIVVGAQMSWIMRPFVGKPEDAFVLLSPTESNFLDGFFTILGGLFG